TALPSSTGADKSTFAPTRRKRDSNCQPVQLTGPRGQVTWREKIAPSDCCWVIVLNATSGAVVTVDEVYLDPLASGASLNSLRVYSGPTQVKLLKTVTGNIATVRHTATGITIPAAVVLVNSREVRIRVVTKILPTKSGTSGGTKASRDPRPWVRFTYMAYALNKLPRYFGEGRYDCSPPVVVPDVMRCDFVRQCLKGEDELNYNCQYRGSCERDSFKYHGNCYRFYFPDKPISPSVAAESCHGADGDVTFKRKLLSPQELDIRQLVARVVELRGYKDIIVDVSKVRTHFSGLDHLYRFLWQWGEYDSEPPRVIFGEPHSRLEKTASDCGVIRNTPSGPILVPVSCSENISSAYVCSELTPVFEIVREKLQLRQPQRKPDKFPTKTCADGSFVHVFHACPSTVKVRFETEWKTKPLNKLYCANGNRVHYSLICDGHDDCGDSSDEEVCGVMVGTVDRSMFFTCKKRPEILPKSYQCDGSPDCQDQSDEEGCYTCQNNMTLCSGLKCLPSKYAVDGICDETAQNHTAEVGQFPPLQQSSSIIDLDGFGMAEKSSSSQAERHTLHFTRYVDVSGVANVSMKWIRTLTPMFYLQYLNLSSCAIFQDRSVNLRTPFVYLRVLDLSHNQLKNLSLLKHWCMPRLSHLDVSHNPQLKLTLNAKILIYSICENTRNGLRSLRLRNTGVEIVDENFFSKELRTLEMLDVAENRITFLAPGTFQKLTSLKRLDLSYNRITSFGKNTFSNLTALETLDIRGNLIRRYEKDVFKGLSSLMHFQTDDFHLCC
ncbi:hypothetical protein BaRGS_00008425, partial [Batillaria attramentaria]